MGGGGGGESDQPHAMDQNDEGLGATLNFELFVICFMIVADDVHDNDGKTMRQSVQYISLHCFNTPT